MDPISAYLFAGTWFSCAVYRATFTSGLFGLKRSVSGSQRVEGEESGTNDSSTGIDGLPQGSEGLPVMVIQSDGFLKTSSYKSNPRHVNARIAIHAVTASDSEDNLYYGDSSSLLRNDSEYSLGLNRSSSFFDDVNTLGPMCAPGQILCRAGNYAVIVGSIAIFLTYVMWPRIPSVRLKYSS
jgi:hypothetical protein